ncbi:hypothetical protein VNI00_002473 [Paramarasmius palmivorus]|uniref:F-box domain-containing protein n=1 Tax=Paramarasmius palmivorus TaxID=297713 RepID=A0AAW0DVS5_9AGAR
MTNVHDLPVPPEILSNIFAFCAFVEPLSPLALGCVCRLWRNVIHASPEVWQAFKLSDQWSLKFLHGYARVWTQYSAPLPFDVYVTIQDSDKLLSLLSPFFRAVARWRRLVIVGEREEDIFIRDLMQTPVDSLDDMSIWICDWSHEDTMANLPRGTFIPLSPNRPGRLAVNIFLTQLPAPNTLQSLCFTSLSITEQCITIHLDPATILDFLSSCPQLQHFCLVGWIHGDKHPSTSSLPVVYLPNLHTLQLRSTCLARSILSSIDVPRLQKLYLAHLNVDFQLPFDRVDSGDSDDEAHDFSQSPWSDHATGMGLRALIKRCNPPIKVLEMDFTDMRTKDFIYLFDRLAHLEVFLIVASDMSNTVINLLKPVRVGSQVSWSEGTPVTETHYRLRLPRLRNLELYNCHRLSGDAIVDALLSRVRYTDQLSQISGTRDQVRHGAPKTLKVLPEGASLSTLKELAIIGCEDFGFRHSQALMREMGSRLRVD